jgi:NhaP-type Na+/H+ or K+/H+ antiporter
MILLGIVIGYLSDYIIFVISYARWRCNSLYYALAVTIVYSLYLFSDLRMLIANSIAVFVVALIYFFYFRKNR